MRTVWFHREYTRLYGGHIKHSHYFGHVGRMPGFVPGITFTGEPPTDRLAGERRELWPPGEAGAAPRWSPRQEDLFFLAGTDWRYLLAGGFEGLPNPRINLVQHVRHAHAGTELHGYLARRAVRICVSEEVADAILGTGKVNGPVLTIPNGIENLRESRSRAGAVPARSVFIAGYKDPELARALAGRLTSMGIDHLLWTEHRVRDEFLDRLGESRVAVCLPNVEEGFYLPALEAMAMGCIALTLDCIGNRSFCIDGENCLIAERTADSLAAATVRALELTDEAQRRLRRAASATVREHSLDTERKRFHAVLRDIDRTWASER